MSTLELTAKVRELKELQIMADELEQEIEGLKDIIKAEMTARKAEEMTVDIFKIKWTTVTSNKFDSKSFKETHQALYEQYTKSSTSRRFSIA